MKISILTDGICPVAGDEGVLSFPGHQCYPTWNVFCGGLADEAWQQNCEIRRGNLNKRSDYPTN